MFRENRWRVMRIEMADPALMRIRLNIVEPTLRVDSTAPWMVSRWLAREAPPDQRLRRTFSAHTSFAPRPPLLREAVGLETLASRMVIL